MLKERFKIKGKIRANHVLAVFFLCFIFYVGLAAMPQFLVNTGRTIQWQDDVFTYIGRIDDQYSGMLENGNQYPCLQSKDTYIDLNGFLAKVLRQPMMNDRVTLKNGHLSHVVSQRPEPEEIRAAADNIIRFHDVHTASGGSFLFVMAPGQISKYEDLLPIGYTDTTNDTADAFLALLDQAGVPYLDLREEMHRDGISAAEAYYTTDHHWLPQTGLWAYRKILEKLHHMGAIDPVDSLYTDPDNFTFETYENTFLGSSGKRTGIYYAGLDDSIYIRPNFETDISVRIPERQLELRGTYEEVCYNTEAVHNYQDPDFYLENSYGLYGWGDNPITHWRNNQAPQQEKFLLVGESFGNIPFSLMSLPFSSCDEVDRRYFTEDFIAYYEEYAPDTVIIEVNVDMTISENTTFAYPG